MRIDTLRTIVEHHQAEEIDGMLVDVQTANLLVKVHDAFKTVTSRDRFQTVDLQLLVGFAWEQVA